MHLFATLFVLFAAALAVYWFMVRPVLSRKEKFRALFQTLDEVEATRLFKIQMLFKGFKNKLWGWLLIILPGLLSTLQLIGDIDPTIVLPFLPEKYQAIVPSFIMIIGVVNLQLRKVTTTPEDAPIVLDAPTVVEVPTIAGKPDVAIVASGTEVVAVAPIVKAPSVAALDLVTKPVKVAEVMEAAQTGVPVVVEAKEAVPA